MFEITRLFMFSCLLILLSGCALADKVTEPPASDDQLNSSGDVEVVGSVNVTKLPTVPPEASVDEEGENENDLELEENLQVDEVDSVKPSSRSMLLEDGSLTLDISELNPHRGDNVTFNCKIRGMAEGSLVKFTKVITPRLLSDTREGISSLLILALPYKNIPRYSIHSYTDGEDKVYELKITGVQFEDSGGYECSVIDNDGVEITAFEIIEVYQIPDDISFVGFNASDVIDVDELARIIPPIVCRASHVLPVPTMTVSVGDRDVTRKFLLTTDQNPYCDDVGNSAKKCPLHCNVNISATSREFTPRYEDDERKLVCRSTMRVHEEDVVETSLVLNVRYKPRIVCEKTEWTASEGALEVKLNCLVYSNPPIGALNRTWVVRKGQRDESRLNFPVHTAEFKIIESNVHENLKVTNTTLVITKVLPQFFTNYYLEVNNDLGPTEQKLTLMPARVPSAGRANQLSPDVYPVLVAELFAASFRLLMLRRHAKSF